MNLFDLYAKITLDDRAYKDGVKNAKSTWGNLTSSIVNGVKTVAKASAAGLAAAGTALVAIGKQSLEAYSEYEQLSGGVQKIFDEMDNSQILKDAQNAWKDLNMTANDYLATINDVGANLASTMGDEKGYEAARKGFKAISDYASGTGKSVDVLAEKFTMITRSTSSYQSIADQFSGILPATSADFLKQAQAAGVLSTSYKKLTEVPIAEYQEAVTEMLEQGVASLGLAGNTANETATTISGSLAAVSATWENLIAGFANSEQDLKHLTSNFVTAVKGLALNVIPKISEILPNIALGFEQLTTEMIPLFAELAESNGPALLDSATRLINTLFTQIPALLTFAADSLPALAAAAASIMGNLGNSIVKIAPELFKKIRSMIVSINWKKVGNDVWDGLEKIDWNGLVDDFFDLLGVGFGALGSFLIGFFEDAWNAISDYFGEWIERGEARGQDFASSILSGVIAGLGIIGKWVYDHIIEPFIEGLIDGLTGVEGAGKEMVASIKKGIKDAWDGLVSWFNGIWDSLFGSRSVDVKVNKSASGGGGSNKNTSNQIKSSNPTVSPMSIDGSHAGGLRRVPFDGYIAELHKGERVLTRQEATRYNRGGNHTFNITVNGGNYSDPTALAKKISEIIKSELDEEALAFA